MREWLTCTDGQFLMAPRVTNTVGNLWTLFSISSLILKEDIIMMFIFSKIEPCCNHENHDTFSPRRWKSRLQPNLESRLLFFALLFIFNLILDKNWWWWQIEPESGHPRSSDRNRPSVNWGLNRGAGTWWRWYWRWTRWQLWWWWERRSHQGVCTQGGAGWWQ